MTWEAAMRIVIWATTLFCLTIASALLYHFLRGFFAVFLHERNKVRVVRLPRFQVDLRESIEENRQRLLIHLAEHAPLINLQDRMRLVREMDEVYKDALALRLRDDLEDAEPQDFEMDFRDYMEER